MLRGASKKNYTRLGRSNVKRLHWRRSAFLLAGLVVMGLAAVWMYAPSDVRANLSDNLVGYWRFDEGSGTTAADQSSAGNDGTLVQGTGSGSPSWVSPGRNNIGSALQFDGSGNPPQDDPPQNTVNVGNDASIDGMGRYMLSMWVNFEPGYTDTGACGTAWTSLIGRTSSGVNWSYMLYINNTTGQLRAHNKQSNGVARVFDGATVVPTGQWVHLAQVADGNNIRIFVNGIEDASLAYDGTTQSLPTANTWIGQDPRGTCAINGKVDDASIHNTFAAPGGVYGGLEYWLRPDDMVLSGGIITQWDDAYSLHTDHTFVGSAPALGAGLNFNRTVTFNNGYIGYFGQQLLYGATAGEIFSTIETHVPHNQNGGFPFEFGGGGSAVTWQYDWSNGQVLSGVGSTVRQAWDPRTAPAGGPSREIQDPHIFNILSQSGEWTARFDGITNFTNTTNTPSFNSSPSGNTYIGAGHNARFSNADLSEVLAYRRALTPTERERVEGYMAVKYGLTLGTTGDPVDYRASDGSSIWTGSATYQNDVAGIGRDDTSLLSQKQSKSENPGAFVTIGNGTITADNESNPNTFDNDLTFFMWGDDAQSTDVVNDVVPVSNTQLKRMQRIWSVQNVGDTLGTLKIQVPQAELAGTSPKVLISDSETFDDTAQQIDMTSSGSDYEADITLSDGQFYTFAVDMVAPETTTNPADNITRDSATLHGTLDGLGDFAQADVFFRYRVAGSGDPFTETTPQTLTAPGAFNAPISGLSVDTQYEFKTVVQWQNAGTQESEGSLLSFVTDPAVPPDAPINLQAVSAGTSQINLSWDAPADEGGSPVTGYQIERSPDGVSGWTAIVPDTGSTDTSYPDTGLTPYTEYFYRVSAINVAGTSSPSNIASATTDPEPLLITTESLPDTTVGIDYSQTLQAEGGVEPYTWSIVSGALPDGLSLNPATGEISGQAQTEGTFNFTVQVTDDLGTTNQKPLSIKVVIPVVLTTSLPDGGVDNPYSQTLEAAGGIQPYTWSLTAGALPDGLSLDPATGEISGVPTATGTFTFTVQVEDDQGGFDDQELSITITETGLPACNEAYVDCWVNPVTGTNVRLVLDDACQISDARIVRESDNAVSDPEGFAYPVGLMNFTADCGTPGYTTTVTQYYFDIPDDNYILRKYNPNTNDYFTIEGASIEQTTIDGQATTIATYQITDGGELDMDGEANGTIVDPAGLAERPSDLADTGKSMLPWITGGLAAIAVALWLTIRTRHRTAS